MNTGIKLTLLAAGCIILLSAAVPNISNAGGNMLQKVEQLTEPEQKALSDARAKVDEALKEVDRLEKEIAIAHSMKGEDWMEWRSWSVIDGKFIHHYFQPHMDLSR